LSPFREAALERVCVAYLAEAGWPHAHASALEVAAEADPERRSHTSVVLERRLRAAIERLNPHLPAEAHDEAIATVSRAESQAPLSENWRVFRLLVEGVPVDYRDHGGAIVHDRARLVDWDSAESNDFLVVTQMTVLEERKTRRPDVVGFVNGLPLALFELKGPAAQAASLHGAYNQIRTYVRDVPTLFTYNALAVVSDGVQARMGTFAAPWEHFAPWKTVDGELADPGRPELEVLVHGVFAPTRFLDILRNFIVYSDEATGATKRVAKYHQYWAVNAAVRSTVEASTTGDGRAGVVWHTQGSGKSLEMLFFASKIMRAPVMQNPTVVVLTDRNDLDDQLFGEVFAPARTLPERPVQAESRDHLRTLLQRASGGIVFTTLQKFALSPADRAAGRPFPTLSERRNIVVIADEAHRSQYDFIDGFARHLRDALPNAAYIGFTGTPIEAGDRSTRQVFGEYIDIYDLTQAVEDGATVRVYYEGRLASISLAPEAREILDSAFEEVTQASEPMERAQLKSRWGRLEAILGSEPRLRELAQDLVEHWETRSQVLAGKALIVCTSRRICAALYDEIVRLRPDWHGETDEEGVVKVVITGSAADDETLQPHIRNKERLRNLKQRAKDPDDPLQLIIVRDMWLTGFDSPALHTMYIDKPMRGSGLMQAIARVNRTFRDKPGGLVVDYIGIADDLRMALADYTDRDRARQDVGRSVADDAVPHLLEKHEVICAMLSEHDWREKAESGADRGYLEAISECVNFLLGDDALRERYLTQVKDLLGFFAIAVPHPSALDIRDDVAFFQAVRTSLTKLEAGDRTTAASMPDVDSAIRQVVSKAITGEGVIDLYGAAGLERPDLSLIDDAFVEGLKRSSQPNLQIEMLRRLLANEIKDVGKRNVVLDKAFSDMLQRSLLQYQNRSIDAAQVIEQLVELARQLKDEHERGAKLNMSDAELAFYDAVRANEAAVLELGDETLRLLASELVRTVRQNATIDWREKETVRARLRAAVRRLLTRYGYPPDGREEATDLVLVQAELSASNGPG
jgi:type I restriction enzyme, R subunit